MGPGIPGGDAASVGVVVATPRDFRGLLCDTRRVGALPPSTVTTGQARRVTSAGLADLTDRQAEAVAALDRALEARLGELDRAFATRQSHLEGARLDAETQLTEVTERGLTELKRAASSERRLLQEQAAAALAELLEVVQECRRASDEAAAAQAVEIRALADRVRALEGRVGESP